MEAITEEGSALQVTSVVVQRASGETMCVDVAAEETVDVLQSKLASTWKLNPGHRVKLIEGTRPLPGGHHVLEVGSTFTAVIMPPMKCASCGSRLDLARAIPYTGLEDAEQAYRKVALALQSLGYSAKARWLWEARTQTLRDALARDCRIAEGGNFLIDGDEGSASESSDPTDSDDSTSSSQGSSDMFDSSYRYGLRNGIRSARCAQCLGETTALFLRMPYFLHFHGIGEAFPKLQRLLMHAVGDGPSGIPDLRAITRLSNLRILDVWLPGSNNGEPGSVEVLGSLISLTHLCILGMRFMTFKALKELLENLTNLEVLHVDHGSVFDAGEEHGSALDLSGHTSLRSLCLAEPCGNMWGPPGLNSQFPALLLPQQLRDAALPHELRCRRQQDTNRWTESCNAAWEALLSYYSSKGTHIVDQRRPWAERQWEAYCASSRSKSGVWA